MLKLFIWAEVGDKLNEALVNENGTKVSIMNKIVCSLLKIKIYIGGYLYYFGFIFIYSVHFAVLSLFLCIFKLHGYLFAILQFSYGMKN